MRISVRIDSAAAQAQLRRWGVEFRDKVKKSVARAISPAMQQLTAPEIDWLALFGERGDDLLTAIAIAAGKPRAWVNELAADEALLLAAKVIEVNADFFTRTVIPRLDGLFAQARNLAPNQAAGSTPSKG